MDFEILNTSVVITAQSHNPTILHPSFLRAEGIVPLDWELAEGKESVVCTFPASIVRYKNGLEFMVEINKFQLRDNNTPEDLDKSIIPDIAMSYIQALPKVRYTAVGINVVGFLENLSAEEFLVNQFLNSRVNENQSLRPQALNLKLVYNVPSATIQLYFDVGLVKGPQDSSERKGIIVRGNYHTDLSASNMIEEAKKNISLFSKHCSDCIERTKEIFEQEK